YSEQLFYIVGSADRSLGWSEIVNHFPKNYRVTRGGDFSDIIRRGALAAEDVQVVNVRRAAFGEVQDVERATDQGPRWWISIPRKTGPAVVRNRWKRWIREAFRLQRNELPSGIDIIVRPKRDAVGSFAAIAKSLRSTTRRAEKKLRR